MVPGMSSGDGVATSVTGIDDGAAGTCGVGTDGAEAGWLAGM